MSESQTDDLEAVVETFWAKVNKAREQGDAIEARAWLEGIVDLDKDNVNAWLDLAEIVQDPQERMQCYVQVLELDPRNQQARTGIRKTRRML